MMLNGLSDRLMSGMQKEALSSHSVLIARRLQYQSGTSWITAQVRELDLMHQANIEYIRLMVRIFEGRVDTELQFEKPKDDVTYQEDKNKVIDLLGEPGFFFPSGTI